MAFKVLNRNNVRLSSTIVGIKYSLKTRNSVKMWLYPHRYIITIVGNQRKEICELITFLDVTVSTNLW